MAQNIYDDADFFAGYSTLPRSVLGLDGAPEWPSLRALLPDVDGKRVVDLGCGFGWFTRWARQQGAAEVLGLDLSEKMLAQARAQTVDSNIRYETVNLENLILPHGAFELAYSSLAFHYVEDFPRLVATVFNALVPGACFVFSIEHPIFMASTHPGWGKDVDGHKFWPVNSYSVEGRRTTKWFADGVIKYHRTIGTTLNNLIDAGFTIGRVDEFSPSLEQISANPDLAEEIERPMMLIVAATR